MRRFQEGVYTNSITERPMDSVFLVTDGGYIAQPFLDSLLCTVCPLY